MKPNLGKCCIMIRKGGPWHFYDEQCTRNASVERGGKSYCKQHDPEAVKARDVARTAKWNAAQETWRHQMAARKACASLSTAALESGVVEEMIELIRSCNFDAEKVHAIIAKLDKEE